MAGDYRTLQPAQPLIAGVARYYRARVNVLGVLPIKGHRGWATPGNETTCPGDAGLAAVIGAIYAHTVAQEVGMTDQEIKDIIDLAIKVQVLDPLAAHQAEHEERGHDGVKGAMAAHITGHKGQGNPIADPTFNPFA